MKPIRIKQILQILLAVGIIALVLRTFVIDAFIVQGDSMAPTVLAGDYVFVNKLAYFLKEPLREDIVVGKFRTHSSKMIKRIVGLPGEKVGLTAAAITLDPKEYFVLGDNRYGSIDSKELGPIDKWDLDGRVFLVIKLKNLSFKVF